MRRIVASALIVLVAGAAACGSAEVRETVGTIPAPTTTAPVAPATTAATALTTTAPPVSDPPTDDQRCAEGSSPTTYDPASGVYATQLVALDGPVVTFDVVQWLVGDDAVTAYHEAEPDDPDGPPNDYWVVNENPRTYAAQVIVGVGVRLVRLDVDADADLDPGSYDELPTYPGIFEGTVFWLTVDDGRITDICEQFTP